jgi:hypothetical protein
MDHEFEEEEEEEEARSDSKLSDTKGPSGRFQRSTTSIGACW